MILQDIENMTPRKRTYALIKLGVRLQSLYCADDDGYYWMVDFSDGDVIHTRNSGTFKKFDGLAACEREAREQATLEKLIKLIQNN